jgi:hypothetical protein
VRLEHKGDYPAHWGVLADAVERAAGNRCIRCGHPKGDGFTRRMPCGRLCTHEKTNKMRVLTVHHMDGDKANDAWWNLLALCQVCHLIVQAKVLPERQYLFEHAAWFKPYVAGFYAHQRGLELSRWSVMQSLDLCLSYGQPWLPPHSISSSGPVAGSP